LIGFAWQAGLVFGVVWLAVAALTRYSSLSGLIASAAAPAWLWYDGYLQEAQLFALLAVIIFLKHHANIARLMAGTEAKIGR